MDVPGHAQNANKGTLGVFHPTGRHFGPDRGPILARLFKLAPKLNKGLACQHSCDGFAQCLLCNRYRRLSQYLFQRLLQDLIAGIAPEFFDGWADVGEPTVKVHHPDDIGGVVRQKAVPLLTDFQQLVVLFAGGQRLRQTSVDTVNVERDGTDDREQQARKVEPCQITLRFVVIDKTAERKVFGNRPRPAYVTAIWCQRPGFMYPISIKSVRIRGTMRLASNR